MGKVGKGSRRGLGRVSLELCCRDSGRGAPVRPYRTRGGVVGSGRWRCVTLEYKRNYSLHTLLETVLFSK